MNENLIPELENTQEVNGIEQNEVVPNDEASNVDNLSKEELLQALKEIMSQEDIPQRAEVEPIKRAFYKLRSAEVEALKSKFTEDGGLVEDFSPIPDALEEEMKELLLSIKDKRAKAIDEEEKINEKN